MEVINIFIYNYSSLYVMKWKEFFRLDKLKIIIFAITFLIFFFVKIFALLEPCNWSRICPDYIRTDIISIYPNFYRPAGCGFGIVEICWKASWYPIMLIFDVIIWLIVNQIIFSMIYKTKK